MGDLVVVGLQELQTVFSTYEQFVGPLCNVFKIYNVRRSLWNGTQIPGVWHRTIQARAIYGGICSPLVLCYKYDSVSVDNISIIICANN